MEEMGLVCVSEGSDIHDSLTLFWEEFHDYGLPLLFAATSFTHLVCSSREAQLSGPIMVFVRDSSRIHQHCDKRPAAWLRLTRVSGLRLWSYKIAAKMFEFGLEPGF